MSLPDPPVRADLGQDEILDMAAHELRTPLASVLGFAEILATSWDDRDDAERRRLADRIWVNAREANELVARLLDFSRLQAGRVTAQPRELRLADEVRRCVGNLHGRLEHHPLTVDVPIDLLVHADRSALEHVLSNLLGNAAKFSAPGAPVVVRAGRRDGEVVVSVTDEGVGITEDERGHVFEQFYRAPGTDASARGIGVGLAIAQACVELLGGHIWVESRPGQGSTFGFTVPAVAEGVR